MKRRSAITQVKEEELLAEIAGKMGYDPAAEFPEEQFKQEVEKVYVGEQGIEVVRKKCPLRQ
ncbi:MAG: hypothetical protein IKS18_00995 [Lachnospiraceae bacterium]|nr:hypothetical protein [Lachnospiraceae bacterium]